MLKDLVLRILNQTVGEYFENIDASQLQLSVFGGDVALHDVSLKTNVFESLGLPFRLSAGKCGTLTLKIPWTSLYSQPVEIGLKDLYLLVVPGSSVLYDEETEAKNRLKTKLRLIENIEAAQREYLASQHIDPSAEEKDQAGYLEKLAMQIVRNLQIRIESIHMLYEDDQSNPGKPFGVGAVLSNLSILTTDIDWVPKYITENVPTIHKVLNLEGLALYWTSDATLFSQTIPNEQARVDKLKSLLQAANFDYMVGPIGTMTKLELTPNPEKGSKPFTVPKMIFKTIVDELALGMSNVQFQDVLQLAESWDFLYRRQQYRKYRPHAIPYSGHSRLWWKFAYKCILEDIQRKRNNWRWVRMHHHRKDCKTYYSALYKKTVGKKQSVELDAEIEELERRLDVFNILLIRKQVDLRRERKEKEEADSKKARGWFSGWFASGTTGEESTAEGPQGLVPTEMSEDEKKALYSAIGYSENSALSVLNYPPEYVDVRVDFRLERLKFLIIQDDRRIRDDGEKETILDLQIIRFQTKLETRPVNSAIKVGLTLGSIEAFGGDAPSTLSRGDDNIAHIIAARKVEGVESFIDMGFERFPLNSNLDQRVHLYGQPLEITYDARTTQKLLECFTLPQQVSLQRLQAKALSKYIEWKAHSTVGILRMVENRGKVEIDVHLEAPYIIIPQNGLLSLASSVLVIELGELLIRSKPPEGTLPLENPGSSPKPSVVPGGEEPGPVSSAVLQLSYDTFFVELRDFQVSLAFAGEVYRTSRTSITAIEKRKKQQKGREMKGESSESIHLLKSGVVVVKIEQCIVPDDARFPKIKINSTLPLVDFDIPEHRLVQLVNLIVTLPLPQSPETGASFTDSEIELAKDASLQESMAVTQITFMDVGGKGERGEDNEIIQVTELLFHMNIEAIKIRVSKLDRDRGEVEPMMALELYSFNANLICKTFGTSLDLKLGGVTLSAVAPDSFEPLYLIRTPRSPKGIDSLLHVHIFTVTTDCPKIHAMAVKQHINVDMSSVEMILHREVLLTIVDFVDQLSTHVAHEMAILQRNLEAQMARAEEAQINKISGLKERGKKSALALHTAAVAKRFSSDPNEVLLKMEARLNQLTVQLATKQKNIMKIVMSNLNGSFVQRPTKMEMFVQLIHFRILNLDPTSCYQNIVTVEADRVIFVHVTKYTEPEGSQTLNKGVDLTKCDMRIKIETGSPKIYILGSFLVEMLNFSNHFATATKAMKRTSAAAAVAATKNVQAAYGNDSRISLNVELRAPKIVLPENDKSLTALCFDFGNLNFSNSFSLVETKLKGKAVSAVIDEMGIAIENVKVSRVQLDKKTSETICEVLLLDPVTFTGKLKRNLSSEWFKGIPAIGFKGKLHSTVLRLSSEDYEVVRGAVFDKLDAMERMPASTIDLREVDSSESSIGLATLEGQFEKGQELLMETIHELNLALDLSLNNLGAVLYQGSSKMEGKKGLVPRDPKASLAEFLIDSVNASLSITQDDHLKCSVILGNLDLKDSRSGRDKGGITNLIQRRRVGISSAAESSSKGHSVTPMIKFVAEKSGTETAVKLTTTSLTFLLCLDHVVQVVKFLNPSFRSTSGTSDLLSIQGAQGTETSSAKYRRKGAMIPKEKDLRQLKGIKTPSSLRIQARSRTSTSSVGDKKSDETPIKAHFKLEALEIVFVENMETIHTNAILLNCEMSMDITSVGERTEIVGVVEGVQLTTCNFHPQQRNQSEVEVVSPTTVMILGSSAPPTGLNLEVTLSDVFVRLSAGTVELLTKITESFAMGDRDAVDGTEVSNYSNIWQVVSVEDRGFWYLEDGAINESNCSKRDVPAPTKFEEKEVIMLDDLLNTHEKLVLKSGSIVLTFEAGSEVITAPLLLVEAALELQIVDWSEEFELAGKMQCAAAYFNAGVGMWEYLIEPVPKGLYRNATWKPLEILFAINKGETDEFSHLLRESSTSLVCFNEADGLKRGSEFVCTIQCNEIMELTLTRTSMHVLTIFAETFNAAAKQGVASKKISTAPYVVENYTGVDLIVDLNDTPFMIEVNGEILKSFKLPHTFQMELSMANDFARYSILKEQQTELDRWIRVVMQSVGFQSRIPISRAEVRCFPWKSGDVMTTEVWVKDCSRVITFRGAIQIFNELNVEVDVLTKEMDFIGTLLPHGSSSNVLNIPLKHVKSGGFFFAPKMFNHSTEPFILTPPGPNSSKVTKYVRCPDYTESESFHVKVVSSSKEVLLENTKRRASNTLNYEIHLSPPFLISNMLPFPLAYLSPSGDELDLAPRGKMIQVTNLPADATNFEIPLRVKGYDGLNWESKVSISKKTDALSAWTFLGSSAEGKTLTLGIHKDYSNEQQLILHLYAPFWMINRTGLNLTYRGEKDNKVTTRHEVDKGIVLFSYPASEVFSKTNKARMKPDEGDWCAPFATETVGLSSFLSSKSARKDYQFGLSIKLCHGGLTKMIVFSPKFYLMNQCSYTVTLTEESASEDFTLLPNICIPFWPKGADPRLRARVQDTSELTQSFFYETGHSTLLQLNNQYGGIQVDVNVGETRVVITLSEYTKGKAPNLLLNVTEDIRIGYRQEGQDVSAQGILNPGESKLVCWPEPTKNRTLLWYPLTPDGKPITPGKEFVDSLVADSFFEFEWSSRGGSKSRYFWISFIEGMQRVTVIAKNELLVRYLKTARDIELPSAEIIVMFSGLGLSLVDNLKCKEVIYLRMSSCGVLWEEQLGGRKWRTFGKEESETLEGIYLSYGNVKLPIGERGRTVGVFRLDNGMEVDLKNMKMTKPDERMIRRSPKLPALWSHIKLFPNSSEVHLKVNRLQVDNQLPDATFVFLLSPVPLPKTVTATQNEGRKPFVEMVFTQGYRAQSSDLQFIHCSFLVQEFQLKLDMGLINALIDLFAQVGDAKINKIMDDFREDYSLATISLEEHQRRAVISVGSKRFYNYLHLSPLKVRVSFSMNGSSNETNNVFLLLLQGLGIDKLADFQDVPFQLACFELRSKMLSDDQLGTMVTSHYTTQGLKQFYVLILGLDFLGNPYALITGITEGIGAFFYEPIQGAILGPDAFKEGLSLGVKSLVGHTVGGAAEALSKMTGTIGKGFAAMTLDNDFQRQRNEAMKQGPQPTSFASTAKGFFKTGIFDAVSGLVTNPIKGAQEDGLQGFGKGLLKGAVGMVTRPVVGAADLARGTLDTFKRVVQDGDELDQIRVPRPVQCATTLQPYNIHSGRGYQIMTELTKKGRDYLKYESYITHLVQDRQVLLVTDRRLLFLKLTDDYGGSSVIWEHEWKEFAMPPYVVERGMELQIKVPPNSTNPLAQLNSAAQLFVPISDPETCMWIMNEIEGLMVADEQSAKVREEPLIQF